MISRSIKFFVLLSEPGCDLPFYSFIVPLEISQRLICLVGSMGTRVVMQEQQWEVLEHPPHSPDLAPSNFHLFGPLKHHLSDEHFPD
jgi:hypothetical protein